MSFVLSTGAKMPSIGFGTWQIDPDLVGNAVYTAVKARTPLRFGRSVPCF
jgi:alcohol dehydrogenase (NADP+)